MTLCGDGRTGRRVRSELEAVAVAEEGARVWLPGAGGAALLLLPVESMSRLTCRCCCSHPCRCCCSSRSVCGMATGAMTIAMEGSKSRPCHCWEWRPAPPPLPPPQCGGIVDSSDRGGERDRSGNISPELTEKTPEVDGVGTAVDMPAEAGDTATAAAAAEAKLREPCRPKYSPLLPSIAELIGGKDPTVRPSPPPPPPPPRLP